MSPSKPIKADIIKRCRNCIYYEHNGKFLGIPSGFCGNKNSLEYEVFVEAQYVCIDFKRKEG